VQNQCKPRAESSLFAEVKPDFARAFLKSECKGTKKKWKEERGKRKVVEN
jgi:hypothetical protein